MSERIRNGPSIRIGLEWGQDLLRARDRRLLLQLMAIVKPRDVWVSWPCACWSGWSRINLSKGGECAARIRSRRSRERVFLRLFSQIWQLQTMIGGHVHGENPVGSHAWNLISLGSVYEVVGLRHPLTKQHILKPTRVVTTDPTLAQSLRECQCPGHTGRGRPLTSWAESYPISGSVSE